MECVLTEERYWDDLLFTIDFAYAPLPGDLTGLLALVASWYQVGFYGGYGGDGPNQVRWSGAGNWARLDPAAPVEPDRVAFSVDMGDLSADAYEILVRCLRRWSLREGDEEVIRRLTIGELPGQSRRSREDALPNGTEFAALPLQPRALASSAEPGGRRSSLQDDNHMTATGMGRRVLMWKLEDGPRGAPAGGSPDDVGPAWLDTYEGSECISSERFADGEWITRAEAARLAEESGFELELDD